MGRIIAGLLLASAVVMGQSSLIDLVMPEARALFGANLVRLRESRLVETLWSRILTLEPQWVERMRAVGFDPRRGVSEVLVAVGDGASAQNALLLARGDFWQAGLISLADKDGARKEAIEGVQIISWQERKQPAAMALVGGALLIAGEPASVRAAVARQRRPAGPAAELRRQAAELSAHYDAWGVSVMPLAQMLALAPKSELTGLLKGGVLEAVEQIRGGVQLGAELALTLTSVSRSDQDAVRLANALRFFAAMAQSYRTGQPPLLKDLSVNGRQMSLSLALSEAELALLIGAAGSARKPPSGAQATPAETGAAASTPPIGGPSGKTMVRQSPQ